MAGIFRIFSNDLAIDLGTANTLIYVKGRGVVVAEPSIVAINKLTGAVEAIGNAAKEMLGRTPANIATIRPLQDGVIGDFDAAEKMLQGFMAKARTGKAWLSPKVIIGIPSGITQVERRAVEDSAYRAKAAEVHLVDEAVCAAIGAGLSITEAGGKMLVDIGGGTTDITVISLGGIVHARSLPQAGNRMDEAIRHYVKSKYNLLIGERTAEQLKIELGSAFPLAERLTRTVSGRNLIQGIPTSITITDDEIREAMAESIVRIVDAVRTALDKTPPELASDIIGRGIVLTGGGALIKHLDKRLSIETGLPVRVADEPLSCVVRGAGEMLSDLTMLKRLKDDERIAAVA